MSFGKVATLLFGLAAVLALVWFAVLPGASSLILHGSSGDGHVVTGHPQGEDLAANADHLLVADRARRAAAAVEMNAPPAASVGEPVVFPPADGSVPDALPAGNPAQVPQPAAAAQPAAPPPPKIQAAPQVSFVPGQPMVDTNPSR